MKNGGLNCEKLMMKVKLEESNARFDKWKDSSKNLDKLINSSMSSRSKFGLGFGDTFGSDEVFDLSAPSIFDSSPKDGAEKPLYDRFVKAVGMNVVPPLITGTFMPPSNTYDLDDIQVTYGSKTNDHFETNSVSNDFVSCDNSDKSSDLKTTGFASCISSVKSSSSKTNEPLASAPSSVDFMTVSETADQQPSSTNDDSSFSFKENIKPPRNLSAFVTAGSRNRLTSVLADRRVTIDNTLFIKKNSRDIILVQVYGEDIYLGLTTRPWCDEFENLDGIFISQDKYVQDMLKKFDMESVRPATTPFEASKAKSKDEPDNAVKCYTLYRSVKGFLHVFDSSRLEMAVCRPTKTMSWYPRDSLPLCWKHIVTRLRLGSHVIKEKPQLDEHNKVGFLEKPKGSDNYHEVLDFLRSSHIRYAISHDPLIYDSLVKQFWSTASLETFKEGPPAIIATIDSTPYTITESLVRSQLQLDDKGGVEDLSIADIYLEMDNMGYPFEGKLTFHKNKFSPQ
ncbi:hypothetical protein Tco_1032570 [Tanacetum coccineum]|uniref:Uncharacterized protein n=1 Tax=Tanacetum coccineum TaxID=301880 RepID=A0ABQ5GCG0_9ASTR